MLIGQSQSIDYASESSGGANGRGAAGAFFLVCRRLRFSSARCLFSISRRRFSNVFWFLATGAFVVKGIMYPSIGAHHHAGQSYSSAGRPECLPHTIKRHLVTAAAAATAATATPTSSAAATTLRPWPGFVDTQCSPIMLFEI